VRLGLEQSEDDHDCEHGNDDRLNDHPPQTLSSHRRAPLNLPDRMLR
jgi:hypothetical protein